MPYFSRTDDGPALRFLAAHLQTCDPARLREIATATGVSVETIQRLRSRPEGDRRGARIDSVEAVAEQLGFRLIMVPMTDPLPAGHLDPSQPVMRP